ncbi:glycosyltransferase [Altericista sp. CCNU0014]|uniref:glycosyltransferase n=1 Tax=Altericista sp. CCNU0014 TaxID=3082949 RepID=UPI00384E6F28
MPFQLNAPMQKHPELSDSAKHPVRILHVVGKMDRGGLETWLMRVLRSIDRQHFQIDIMVHSQAAGDYDPEVLALGCRILPCPYLTQPWRYAWEFKRVLSAYGPYDVVHSHVHFFSGYVLQIAKAAKVPCLIAHSHNDHRAIERSKNWLRQGYLSLMKRSISRSMTHGLTTSQQAALDLFGPAWVEDERINLLFSGLDLHPFVTEVAPDDVRQEWQIPADAWVIGHVGRFEPQKNHDFLVRVAAEAMHQHPNSYLLLVGQGSLQPQIERQVRALGIGDRVVFTGPRSDIAAILLGGMDAFLFPSIHEGLGVAIVEAQAAGLPCLISDVVPVEADVVPGLVRRLSLARSTVEWANALLTHSRNTPRKSVKETLPSLEASPFNMENTVPLLEALYAAAANQ